KTLLKRILKALWNATGPVRRPFQRKLKSYAHTMAAEMVNAHMPGVIHRLQCVISATAYDTNLVLNSLVREVARLQMQVEILQQYAEEAHAAQHALSVDQDEAQELPPYDNQHAQVA
ncbi:MAG TPA: hypothetical protein VGY53_05290, partial [Isosphaeraceae bacterium]|nr:hypothetical protein [Isosphaeraceae bacterium]